MNSSPRKALQSVPVRIGIAVVAVGLLVAIVAGAGAVSAYRNDLSARLNLDGQGPPPAYRDPGSVADPAKSALLFVGDSRIRYWPTPNRLADVHVINLGRSGETTAQLLARLDADIIDREPRMVVLQTGINDLKAMGVFRSRSSEIAERCWANLSEIIDRLRSLDIPVVVLTIFPVATIHPLRYPFWSNDTLKAVAEINERLRRLEGPGVQVFDCDSILLIDGRMRTEYVVDDFHVNRTAYEALSAEITPFLTDALAQGNQHTGP